MKTIYAIEREGKIVAAFDLEEDRDFVFQTYWRTSEDIGNPEPWPSEIRVFGSRDEWRREQET
jgi:hypothetical protein